MNYGNQEYGDRVGRAMDSVQDRLERDVCTGCGHTRQQHANGQGVQPVFIRTDCNVQLCACVRFKETAL